jgi:hypothetical protein
MEDTGKCISLCEDTYGLSNSDALPIECDIYMRSTTCQRVWVR